MQQEKARIIISIFLGQKIISLGTTFCKVSVPSVDAVFILRLQSYLENNLSFPLA